MYIKLSFMAQGHRFNFLSISLVKLHNTPLIGGRTTIKSLFSRETETKKSSKSPSPSSYVSEGCKYALKQFFHIFEFFSKSMGTPLRIY